MDFIRFRFTVKGITFSGASFRLNMTSGYVISSHILSLFCLLVYFDCIEIIRPGFRSLEIFAIRNNAEGLADVAGLVLLYKYLKNCRFQH